MSEINIIKSSNLKDLPDTSNLVFGTCFTDHMFSMDYTEEKGWHDAKVCPFENISLSPAAMCLHYGQEVFEGLKAYKHENGKVFLFRPKMNMKRLNESNKRLCIPLIDEDLLLEGIKKLVETDERWIPNEVGSSLYLRPFIIACDPRLGVHPAHQYKLLVIACPVGMYYKEGINPVKIYVEDNYVRAVRGGLGYAKTAANYAASLKAQQEAEDQGFTQVLWLDGVERKYVEEVGTMNVFFVVDNKVITPSLTGSILPGVTRDSCLQLIKSWGLEHEETRIDVNAIFEAAKNGNLQESFGTGTAAVISPIGVLKCGDEEVLINNNEIGSISRKLYDTITGVQWGKIDDEFNWLEEVK